MPYASLLQLPHFLEAPRKVYVASSWRNDYQPEIVAQLRAAGHEAYDFKNPAENHVGFKWSDVSPEGAGTMESYMDAINHPTSQEGFARDKAALDWSDTCVLVLPSGRSAHFEAGYCAGAGKHVVTWLHRDRFEPELMYLLGNDIVLSGH